MKKVTGERVAVIGGGVIGALCAWELSDAGFDVTIIDKGKFGGACSHGNCGYVSPSHVLPLCQPGAITKTLKAMLKKNSPFAIKPRLNSGFFKWFLKFASHCNRRTMMKTGAGRDAMLQNSKQFYQELIESQKIECEWQEVGLLFVFDDEKTFEEYGKTDSLLRNHFGVAATPYDGEQLVELEPAIKPGFGGAWHYEGDCHMRPDLFLIEIRQRLENRGVQVLEGFQVDQFVRENGSARTVLGNGQSVEADIFVVATGAWTPFLNKHLGFQVPIEPGKGYSLTMPKPARMPKIPIIFEDSHVAITPMKSKYRIGSTMEFVGYDTTINPKRLGILKTAAAKYLHDPHCDPIEETWYGWRPMTWDGKPVIDRSPAMSNVWVAAGHSMLGLSMATGTGKLIRQMILGENPHVDPVHFSIARL
ncbi:MAG: FAD-dependent oxidoreductase [Planctomycetota bacterium]